MLVLSRKEGEKIVFPTIGVTLELLRMKGNTARLGIDAPKDLPVVREELRDRAEQLAQAARKPSGKLSHKLRNRLHTASLALHLYKRQLERGMTRQAEATLDKVLKEFETIENEAAAASKAPKPMMPEPRKRRRTLVVEDDVNESELLAGFLRMSGFEVTTAGDGAAALDYLSHHATPDLMLLDMIMPRCDGPATVDALRRHPEYQDMKVFAISGTSPDRLGVPTGPSGIDRWFPKPVNPEMLVREISRELTPDEPAAGLA